VERRVHVEDAEVVDHLIAGLAFGRGDVLGAAVAVEFAEAVKG
jgi:hypothetical protein